MSSASYNSNHQDGNYHENMSGPTARSKSSAPTMPHLRSVQNLREFQMGDLSPGRELKNAGDLKKQKRMLESVYNDYIEKIRGPDSDY